MAPLEPVELLRGRLPHVRLPQETPESVCKEVGQHAAELAEMLDMHGGVLVTAPALRTAADFEAALAVLIDLAQSYPGGAPRQKVTEGGVFTSTEYPPCLPIPAHTELSYMPRAKPELIAFFCEVAPRRGGMTPALDMAEVLRRLPRDLVARFSPGLLTSLNLPPEKGAYLCTRRAQVRDYPKDWKSLGESREAAADKFREGCLEEVAAVEWTSNWMEPYVPMPAVSSHRGMQVWTGFFPAFHWAGNVLQTLFDLCCHNRSLGQLRVSFWVFALTALAGQSAESPARPGRPAEDLGDPRGAILQAGERPGRLLLGRLEDTLGLQHAAHQVAVVARPVRPLGQPPHGPHAHALQPGRGTPNPHSFRQP
eukprot:CAMPEP_0175598194 /NCGR_PEP_ID=MMETSP0096-20121207/56424_1 /TAXON_ID=311494 /ORGANISM="Alexandrium monilatum, Strain CCMP3105" /LENGTH=366 /DNA_ID=CAMNT_0016902685 /DNA_START=8 /DNA_END=1105 /DNA_ORIENTATION=-